ncbi:hypothetical protein NC652_033037 [Populus alba x Populus x berolinensis]|nr:hypothetical protein NC652_033037 [Populus alba x Populus x berolinensis]
MMKQLEYFNLTTSFTTKKGRKQRHKIHQLCRSQALLCCSLSFF